MDSSARRAFQLLRQHPVLLGAPLLGVSACNFLLSTTFQNILRPPVSAVRVRALRAEGHAAVPELLSALRTSLIRFGLFTSLEIFQYALQAAALALTIMLVVQLSRNGEDTFSGAIERLRKIPALTSTVVRFGLLFFLIVVASLVASAVPFFAIVISRSRVGGMHTPPHMSTLTATAFLIVWLTLCAYFVMPYFLDLMLHVQQLSFPNDFVRKRITVRAWRYAAVAIGATVLLGLLVRDVRLPLNGTPMMDDLIVRNMVGLIASIITSLPRIPFVVAAALLVMNIEEPVTEAERA